MCTLLACVVENVGGVTALVLMAVEGSFRRCCAAHVQTRYTTRYDAIGERREENERAGERVPLMASSSSALPTHARGRFRGGKALSCCGLTPAFGNVQIEGMTASADERTLFMAADAA